MYHRWRSFNDLNLSILISFNVTSIVFIRQRHDDDTVCPALPVLALLTSR